MKGFLALTTLLLFALSATSCGAPASVPTAPPPAVTAPTKSAPTRVLTTSATVPLSPTPIPLIPPTAEPQMVLGETKTYRDPVAGFELDYPTSWNLTPIGDEAKKNSIIYSATIFSFAPGQGGSEGIPPGASKMDIGVIKNGAQSLRASLDMRKQEFANGGLDQKIQSEQEWVLEGGLKAVRLQVSSRFGESVEVLTALNGNTILLGGLGDPKLIDTIARTLRPIDTSSNDTPQYRFEEGAFSLQLPASWQAFGPTKIVNDPDRPFSLYVLGIDPANQAGPGASKIVIADAGMWTSEQFVHSQCSTCPVHPFETIPLGDRSASRTQIGGGGVPFLITWYFIENKRKLIALAIHDP